VALELAEFQLEYVTGVMSLAPVGDPTRFVVPSVSVTNAGPTAAHTRTLVYRATAHDQSHEGFNLALDSATDNASYGEPITDLVRPGTTWSWTIDDWTGVVGAHGRFWFSIRTTSPNLVPSIEFIEADTSASDEPEHLTQTMNLRYMPGDFAVFHHRIRYLAPVPPGPRTMLE
jgi:hypothetical protein